MFRRAIVLATALGSVLFIAACGSGAEENDESSGTTPPPAGARTRSAGSPTVDPEATDTPGATPDVSVTAVPGTPAAAGAPVQPAGSSGGSEPPAPPPPAPRPAGRTYTLSDAQAMVQAALMPADIGPGWTVMSDVTTDNATAAANDPRGGASFERCRRLTGRLLTLQPPQDQIVPRYVGGESVSFFTTISVFATADGATDCAIEAAQRFSEPGELARQFASIFLDVNAVVVTPLSVPQVADGSIAFTLEGQINASGTVVDLTILIVAFRKGNVSAVVGSAAASTPSLAELAPLVDLVIARIAAAQ